MFKVSKIILLAWMSSSILVHANDENPIQSGDGGNPFLVVKTGLGASQREPGIYKRNENGEWQILFKGEVLLDSRTGNIRHQMKIGPITRRFEAMAIVDGRLRLFSTESELTKKNTYIDIGVDRMGITDALGDRVLQLPSIKDASHVHVYSSVMDNDQVELVVVSVKLPKEFPLEGFEGLTFGFAVHVKSCVGSQLKLMSAPVLLSNQFLTPEKLSKHIVTGLNSLQRRFRFSNDDGGAGFVSTEVLKRLSKPQAEDPLLLKEWREDLKAYLNGGEPNTFFVDDLNELPLIDFSSGQIFIGSLPVLDSQGNVANPSIVYDPIRGRHKTLLNRDKGSISLKAFDSLKSFSESPFQVDDERLLKGAEVEIGRNHSDIVITESGQYILLLQVTDRVGKVDTIDRLFLKPLRAKFGKIKDFAAISHKESGLLFTSWRDEEGREVTCAHIVHADQYPAKISMEGVISEKFYDHDALDLRINNYGADDGGTKILGFDDLTDSKIKDEDLYEESHRSTGPHVDVLSTLKNIQKGNHDAEVFFPEPRVSDHIQEKFIYREYEFPEGSGSSLGFKRTGFFVVKKSKGDKDDGIKSFINAQWLTLQGVSQEGGYLWDKTTTISVDDNNEKQIRISAVAATTNPQLNAAGTILLFLSEGEGSDSQPVMLQVPGTKIFSDGQGRGFPPELLKSFAILHIQPPRIREKKAGVIIGTAAFEGKGTLLFQIPFDYKDRKMIFTPESKDVLISTDFLSPDEVWGRLRRDHRDQLVFILTPEKEETDSEFSVFKIDEQKPLRVGSTGRIQLKSVVEVGGQVEHFDPGTWRVSEFGALTDDERRRRDRLKGGVEFDYDFFPHFRELLNRLADPTQPARHIALLVPQSLKRYAQDYPMAIWLRKGAQTNWSAHVRNFRLMTLPTGVNGMEQTEVFENYRAMREATNQGRRVALFTTLDAVRQLAVPKASDRKDDSAEYAPFLLKNQSVQNIGISGVTSDPNFVKDDENAPHLLYLMATEGKALQINQFKPGENEKKISTIMIGTKTDWDQFEVPGIEGKHGLKKHFEVIELQPPTAEMREQFILTNVFGMSVVSQLGYEVDLNSFVRPGAAAGDNPYLVVARYLVSRAETLANDNKFDVFEYFLKVMSQLGQDLTQDWEIRNTRKIDRSFIERLLAKVFPMPLSLDILPPSDPLRVAAGKDFIRMWHRTGFHGQMGIKLRMQQILLSSLLPSEGRNVPASFLLYGEHGLGKTSLLDSLFMDVLKLKQWKIGATDEENKGATYMRINLQEIVDPKGGLSSEVAEKGSATNTSYPIDKVVTALDKILASPNGWRSVIILDDVHRAPDSVRSYFLARFRALQDHRTYSIKGAGGKLQEFPTRNLVLGVVFNLTDDRERIKKFAQYEWNPSEEEWILATLSGGEFSLDRSSLARFGTRINYQGFTPDAKGPKLRDEWAKIAKTGLNSGRSLKFISPEVVNEIVEQFPTLNARDFLSAATRGLAGLRTSHSHSLSIIVPKNSIISKVDPKSEAAWVGRGGEIFGKEEGSKLERFIQENYQSIPVWSQDVQGKMALLYYLLDNFRNRAFYMLVSALSDDEAIQSEASLQRFHLLPIAQAVTRHLRSFQEPPVKDLLSLEPIYLGARSELDIKAIREEIIMIDHRQHRSSEGKKPFPKFQLERGNHGGVYSGDLIRLAINSSQGMVMMQTIRELKTLNEQLLSYLMHRDGSEEVEDWLKRISQVNIIPKKSISEFKTELLQIYLRFVRNMEAAKPIQDSLPITQYDMARFFVILYDQAIHRLNWAKTTALAFSFLQNSTQDLSFAQKPLIQKLLFESGEREDKWSVFVPLDSNAVFGFIENIPSISEEKDSEIPQHSRFEAHCQAWLKNLGEHK